MDPSANPIVLRSRGVARYFSGGFLAFWLCGWALGEGFALWFLGHIVKRLVSGPTTFGAGEILGGGFILVWLSFWTIGGIAAITEFLRLVFGEDRIAIAHGRLHVRHGRGLFWTERTYESNTIRGIEQVGRAGRVEIEIGGRTIELTRLGSADEREELVRVLRAQLGVADRTDAPEGVLPPEWEAIVTPEGDRALVPNRRTRALQARVAFGVAVALGAVAALLVRAGLDSGAAFVPAAIVAALAVACGAGARWLARGRMEWRIGSGRITHRKRDGGSLVEEFVAHRLRIEITNDSDGDDWYELVALAEEAPPETSSGAGLSWTGHSKHRRTVDRRMENAPPVRSLARWLAHAADLPLEDRSTRKWGGVRSAAAGRRPDEPGTDSGSALRALEPEAQS